MKATRSFQLPPILLKTSNQAKVSPNLKLAGDFNFILLLTSKKQSQGIYFTGHLKNTNIKMHCYDKNGTIIGVGSARISLLTRHLFFNDHRTSAFLKAARP